MVWVIATLILIVSIIGVVMTLLMLPGMWVVLLTVMLAKLIEPDIMPWWAILVIAVIVLIAELMEFLSSAAGAKVGGATKKGMTAAVIGGIVGAIAATFLIPIPVIGSLLGGVIGAGLGTVLVERGGKRTWRESGKAGAGAAVGRFAATFIKTGLAILMGLFATLMAFWPTPAPVEGTFLPESAPPGMIESEEP